MASDSRVPPEAKLQQLENDRFNIYLSTRADKKLDWMYLPKRYSVRQISNLRKTYDI